MSLHFVSSFIRRDFCTKSKKKALFAHLTRLIIVLLALICIAAVSNVEDPFDSIGTLFQLQFDHDKQATMEEEELIWGSIVSDLLMCLKGIP